VKVVVRGSFDDLRSRDVRFLQEAARLGDVHALLWGDEGTENKFPVNERLYFMQSLRYVAKVTVVDRPRDENVLPEVGAECWAVREAKDNAGKRQFCEERGIKYRVIAEEEISGFATGGLIGKDSGLKKVLVTGCYDWLHTGHVRFFEEVSEYGDVCVVVGHDANIKLLKGANPKFGALERCYMVQAVRYVKQAMISSGHGWLDAEPEIRMIKPDIYAVNEDGDKAEKREYCREKGIEYLVLKRLPKEGLPKRESRILRGW